MNNLEAVPRPTDVDVVPIALVWQTLPGIDFEYTQIG